MISGGDFRMMIDTILLLLSLGTLVRCFHGRVTGGCAVIAIGRTAWEERKVMPNKSKKAKPSRQAPAPKPTVGKIEGDWKELIKKQCEEKHPGAGWARRLAARKNGEGKPQI
jgi:hypothetical protein